VYYRGMWSIWCKKTFGQSMMISDGHSSESQGKYLRHLIRLRRAHDSYSRYIQAGTSHAQPSNLLGQLLPLTNLPKVQADLNTFYLSHLSSPPSSSTPPKSSKKSKLDAKSKKSKKSSSANLDVLPDWMATYDSPSSDDEDTAAVPGSKKRVRTSQLSIHSSIHSIPSHTAAYTTLWETILSQIDLDEYWTRRILVGLHGEKGILGRMKSERRVRVADWLGGLVDRGGVEAVLAMNGLYVLMTKYNL
jgi:U3 small nucleolar RNA-associated protein 19